MHSGFSSSYLVFLQHWLSRFWSKCHCGCLEDWEWQNGQNKEIKLKLNCNWLHFAVETVQSLWGRTTAMNIRLEEKEKSLFAKKLFQKKPNVAAMPSLPPRRNWITSKFKYYHRLASCNSYVKTMIVPVVTIMTRWVIVTANMLIINSYIIFL